MYILKFIFVLSSVHLEVLGQVAPRATLYAPRQRVRGSSLRTFQRVRTRQPAGEDAHAIINT